MMGNTAETMTKVLRLAKNFTSDHSLKNFISVFVGFSQKGKFRDYFPDDADESFGWKRFKQTHQYDSSIL